MTNALVKILTKLWWKCQPSLIKILTKMICLKINQWKINIQSNHRREPSQWLVWIFIFRSLVGIPPPWDEISKTYIDGTTSGYRGMRFFNIVCIYKSKHICTLIISLSSPILTNPWYKKDSSIALEVISSETPDSSPKYGSLIIIDMSVLKFKKEKNLFMLTLFYNWACSNREVNPLRSCWDLLGEKYYILLGERISRTQILWAILQKGPYVAQETIE